MLTAEKHIWERKMRNVVEKYKWEIQLRNTNERAGGEPGWNDALKDFFQKHHCNAAPGIENRKGPHWSGRFYEVIKSKFRPFKANRVHT